MRQGRRLVAVLASFCAVVTGAVIVPADAEACSWRPGVLADTIPDDGGEIPQDGEISLWFKPGGHQDVAFELSNGDGENVPVEVEVLRYGTEMGLVEHYRVIPETLLDVGSYTLTGHPHEDDNHREKTTLSLDVADQSVEAPPTPEDFQWTRIDDPPPKLGCIGRSEQWNDIVVDDGSEQTGLERDDVWIEVSYDTNGDGVVASHPASTPLRHYIVEVADCVTVEAVAVDGSRSDSVQRCQPDVCKEGEENNEGTERVLCGCSATDTSPMSVLWAAMVLAAIAIVRRTKTA